MMTNLVIVKHKDFFRFGIQDDPVPWINSVITESILYSEIEDIIVYKIDKDKSMILFNSIMEEFRTNKQDILFSSRKVESNNGKGLILYSIDKYEEFLEIVMKFIRTHNIEYQLAPQININHLLYKILSICRTDDDKIITYPVANKIERYIKLHPYYSESGTGKISLKKGREFFGGGDGVEYFKMRELKRYLRYLSQLGIQLQIVGDEVEC